MEIKDPPAVIEAWCEMVELGALAKALNWPVDQLAKMDAQLVQELMIFNRVRAARINAEADRGRED